MNIKSHSSNQMSQDLTKNFGIKDLKSTQFLGQWPIPEFKIDTVWEFSCGEIRQRTLVIGSPFLFRQFSDMADETTT